MRLSRGVWGWTIAGILACAAPGAAQDGVDTLRVFEADLGPAYIDVSGYPPEMQAAYPLFAQRCSKCHTLARPINSSMKGDEWLAYVTRMSNKPGSGISPRDVESIFGFLSYDSQVRARVAGAVDPVMEPFLKVSRELGGVPRIPAHDRNIPADAESLRIRIEADARLNVKKLFHSDENQRLLRWSPREPGRAELLRLNLEGEAGDSPAQGTPAPGTAAITAAAQEALEGEEDPQEKVELILDWLDESITRTYVSGNADPEATLAAREGDATEFTSLFVRMAEAAGIPARSQVGLVAQRTSFHYHAWAEVWLGRWIPVDPYLGQFPADITHLRFVSQGDDDLTSWSADRFAALDRLKLRLLVEEANPEAGT